MALKPPIRTRCEGSRKPTRIASLNGGECVLCGVIVTCNDEGIAFDHNRNDIVTMLSEGFG